jgi:hypothetical protein
VPDNQEVYIDKDGFTSIIVEINERVGSEGSSAEIDGRALTTHLEEIVGEDASRLQVWNTTPTQFSKLEYVHKPFPPLPFRFYSSRHLPFSAYLARVQDGNVLTGLALVTTDCPSLTHVRYNQ